MVPRARSPWSHVEAVRNYPGVHGRRKGEFEVRRALKRETHARWGFPQKQNNFCNRLKGAVGSFFCILLFQFNFHYAVCVFKILFFLGEQVEIQFRNTFEPGFFAVFFVFKIIRNNGFLFFLGN